jgi:hypothetical protein
MALHNGRSAGPIQMSNPLDTITSAIVADDCEIISVPNRLLMKVGPDFKSSGAAAVARAEKAMQLLSANFGEWLEQEVAALEQVRATLKQDGLTTDVMSLLSVRALDLKGLGATYHHPLVTRIGGSLFKLLDENAVADIPVNLIDAHVDAVRAIVRNQIRDAAHPVGLALVMELELRVRELGQKTPQA